MASFNLNRLALNKQRRALIVVILCIVLVLSSCLLLVPKKKSVKNEAMPLNLTGIVDETFSDANAESAMSMQQVELESLKRQITELKDTIQNRDKAQAAVLSKLVAEQVKSSESLKPGKLQFAENTMPNQANDAHMPWQSNHNQDGVGTEFTSRLMPARLHSVSFHYGALLRNPCQCLLSQNSGGSTALRHS